MSKQSRKGFTLVEVLAAITIIGIIVFLALPNITTVRSNAEEQMAIARGEAVNQAISSYISSVGHANAVAGWSAATTADAKYALVAPYLAYAPSSLSSFMPSGYGITLPASLATLPKATLTKPSGAALVY